MRLPDRVRQHRPGGVTGFAGREYHPEGHLDIRQVVARGVADLVRSHVHPERFRLRPAGGQDVHVDGGAPADGGEQQLHRGEACATAGAEGDLAAPVVTGGETASRDPLDGYAAVRGISRHGVDSARLPGAAR